MLVAPARSFVDQSSQFVNTPAALVQFLSDNEGSRSFLPHILKHIPMNATIKQVLNLRYKSQKEYVRQLLEFNLDMKDFESETNPEKNLYRSGNSGMVHRYNQMPCSVATRHRRAALLEQRGFQKSKILLLGDDDLLSVELSKRNFADIIVADCDRYLLERIDQLTQNLALPPKIFEADFQRGFHSLQKANVACVDPAHTVQSIKVFLKSAIDNLDGTKKRTIYLMFNPFVIGQEGTSEIVKHLRIQNFKLQNHLPRFNAYPFDPIQKLTLRLCWRFLLGKKSPIESTRTHYFFSDCFEFVCL